MDCLKRDPRVQKIQKDPDDPGVFHVLLADGTQHFVSTHNGKIEYDSVEQEHRAEVVAKWAEHIFADTGGAPKIEEIADHLVPVLRGDDASTIFLLQAKAHVGQSPALVSKSVGPSLAALLAIDHPTRLQYLDAKDLSGWGVTEEELYDRALSNLAKMSPEGPQMLDNGFYGSSYDDCFDATRSLLPDWASKTPLGRNFLLAVPCRSTVWIARPDQASALLAATEKAYLEDSYAISCLAFLWNDGELTAYQPTSEDPVHPLVVRSHQVDLMKRYADQKEMLQLALNKEGRDVFVATQQVYKRKDSSLVSRCVWSRGVPTLLPTAEQLVFIVGEHEEPLMVPWESALEVIGYRMEALPDLVPQRWSVKEYPDDAEIEKLRKLRVGT